MNPARRIALVSVVAAAVLIALKLGAGLATNSLGLVSEAAHSGTDLAAALLTFFALGVSGRPADATHGWGHGKAEHLSALAESVVLGIVGGLIVWQALRRLAGDAANDVETPWYAFAVIGVVIVVDLTRAVVSARGARRFESPALLANAVHFAADLAGTLAVLVGLILTRSGHPKADAGAALFVALLVLVAAARLAKANVDVLMDRTPGDAAQAARRAIEALAPDVRLERLRLRSAAGRHFADAVVSISPAATLAEGHTLADSVEDAVRDALPNADVVVHVEPGADPATLPERALAAALTVPGVREIHNVRVIADGKRTHVSLHLKFPADSSLQTAHSLADRVENAIHSALPEVEAVTTHLEPLDGEVTVARVAQADLSGTESAIHQVVRDVTGQAPRAIRLVGTDAGLVGFVTLILDGNQTVVDAHEVGGTVRSRLRQEVADLHDVVVHTEPSQ